MQSTERAQVLQRLLKVNTHTASSGYAEGAVSIAYGRDKKFS